MSPLDGVPIQAIQGDRCANPYPGGDLPWQVYQDVRNALVRTCRLFGPTGPMGEVTIDWNVDDPYLHVVRDENFWPLGDADPTYYLVVDKYNDEQYCYAELDADAFSDDWLLAIMSTLRDYGDWALSIGLGAGNFVLIFGSRLVISGREFAKCRTAADVIEVSQTLLRKR